MVRKLNNSRRLTTRNNKYVNESFDTYLDNVYSYIRKINNEVPPSDGYLDVLDCGDGSYKLVVMDDMGRIIKEVSDCYKPIPFVSFVRGLYQILKQWWVFFLNVIFKRNRNFILYSESLISD